MLRSRFFLAGIAVAALATAACSGKTETISTGGSGGTGGGTGGTGGSGNTGNTGPGELPPDAGPDQAGDGPGVVLAIHKLYLGDTDRKGNPSSSAWDLYGYDLDGKISTKDSDDLCDPAAGAKEAAIYEDGENGRDNSFGKNILPIITSLAMDASSQINDSIDKGAFTIMLKMEAIGTGDNYNPLTTKLYGGAKLVDAAGMEITPKWDGTDAWPVIPELLNDGNIDNPLVQFSKSYLVKTDTGRTWVSGGKADIKLNLGVGGFTIGLTIGSALIATDLAADNKSATNGTIAGILNTENLINELAKVAGSFDPSLCPPSSTFESIAQQIRQASDIMSDGTQKKGTTCDGISIGLGFDMDAIQLGEVADPTPAGVDPCKAM